MFKKILVGIVVTGLAGALVIGAAARTAGIASNADHTVGRQQGRDQAAGTEAGRQGQQERQNGNGAQRNSAESGQGNGGQGNGGERSRGNHGQGGGGSEQANAAAYAAERLTVSGTVLQADADALTVSLDGGAEVVVDGRAWSYAQEQGFTARPGDTLTLTGFYDGDTFEVGQIENLTQPISVTLRDDSGRPQWAGGRGNGNR